MQSASGRLLKIVEEAQGGRKMTFETEFIVLKYVSYRAPTLLSLYSSSSLSSPFYPPSLP